MAARPLVEWRAKRTGLGLLSPESGLDALYSILDSFNPIALIAVVPVAWQVLLRASRGRIPEFFAEMTGGMDGQMLPTSRVPPAKLDLPASPVQAASDTTVPAIPTIHAHHSAVLSLVLDTIQGILGIQIDASQPLMEAGLDSLGKSRAVWVRILSTLSSH